MTVTCFVLPSLTDGVVLRMSAQSNNQPTGMIMHEITSTNHMFYDSAMPCLGLGKVLSEYQTLEDDNTIAHPMDPVTAPVCHQVPRFDPAVMQPIPNHPHEA